MKLQTSQLLAVSLLGVVPMVENVCLSQNSSKAAALGTRRVMPFHPQ